MTLNSRPHGLDYIGLSNGNKNDGPNAYCFLTFIDLQKRFGLISRLLKSWLITALNKKKRRRNKSFIHENKRQIQREKEGE